MLLFVYGTLRAGLAHGEAARLVAGLAPGIPASAAGELYLAQEPLGCYPLLVPGLDGRVRGEVLDCPDDPAWLAELDAYEGSDYRRLRIVVALDAGGELAAEAYLCLLPDVSGLERIPHGDFARFVEETGARPFDAGNA